MDFFLDEGESIRTGLFFMIFLVFWEILNFFSLFLEAEILNVQNVFIFDEIN